MQREIVAILITVGMALGSAWSVKRLSGMNGGAATSIQRAIAWIVLTASVVAAMFIIVNMIRRSHDSMTQFPEYSATR